MLMIAGWIGAIGCLLAYLYIARGGKTIIYHMANVIGATLLIPINVVTGSWPSVFINLSYGIIAIVGLINARRAKQRRIYELDNGPITNVLSGMG